MDREALRKVLRELLEETTGQEYPNVTEDQTLQEGLGLDSVDMFSLIVDTQSKFQIKIATEDVATVTTVGQYLDVVQAKLAAAAMPKVA
jgi:acyl carrier protein